MTALANSGHKSKKVVFMKAMYVSGLWRLKAYQKFIKLAKTGATENITVFHKMQASIYLLRFTSAYSKEKTHTFSPGILYKDTVLLETEVIK